MCFLEVDCDIWCICCDIDICGGIKGVFVYSCKWSIVSNFLCLYWYLESYIRGNDMYNNSIYINWLFGFWDVYSGIYFIFYR